MPSVTIPDWMIPPRWMQWVLGSLAGVAIVAGLVMQLGVVEWVVGLVGNDEIVRVPAAEYQRRLEDSEHVGELCEDLDPDPDVMACHPVAENPLHADCFMVKHVGTSHTTWAVDPAQFPRPPKTLGSASSAGIGPPPEPSYRCERTGCYHPPRNHGGYYEILWLDNAARITCPDEPWQRRHVEFDEGCVLRVWYNVCGEFYDWDDDYTWLCCYGGPHGPRR